MGPLLSTSTATLWCTVTTIPSNFRHYVYRIFNDVELHDIFPTLSLNDYYFYFHSFAITLLISLTCFCGNITFVTSRVTCACNESFQTYMNIKIWKFVTVVYWYNYWLSGRYPSSFFIFYSKRTFRRQSPVSITFSKLKKWINKNRATDYVR